MWQNNQIKQIQIIVDTLRTHSLLINELLTKYFLLKNYHKLQCPN